jgi:hypothetical protein
MASESHPAAANPDLTLEHQAAGAGLALACAFSSSDEFYADIIHERRSAGAYGAPWYRAPAAIVSALIVLFAGILFIL